MRLTPHRAAVALVAAVLAMVFAQPPARAIPAFARKFQVNCYHCHTIFPRLNKMGYLFKRNGYRLPPKIEKEKPTRPVKELDAGIPIRFSTSAAFSVQGSLARESEGVPGSLDHRTRFDLDYAVLLTAGPVPGTGFFYLGRYALYYPYGDHGPELSAATLGYSWGRADKSAYVKAGKMFLTQGEGFRASDPRGVLPWAPLALSSYEPGSFTLDQDPWGVAAGATWASPGYRRVFGLSAKVTQGLRPNGEPARWPGSGGQPQFLVSADYLFANDSGVSVMYFGGREHSLYDPGTPMEAPYSPRQERWGIFASHLVAAQLDLSAGIVGGHSTWRETPRVSAGSYTTSSWFAEASYYPEAWRGFVLSGRIEGLREREADEPAAGRTRVWALSAQKALLRFGDLALRVSYRDLRRDAPASPRLAERQLKLDLRYAW